MGNINQLIELTLLPSVPYIHFMPLREDMKHNIGAMNQYLLTMSLLLHYSTYCADLRAVQITPNLQFDPIGGIITIGSFRPENLLQ